MALPPVQREDIAEGKVLSVQFLRGIAASLVAFGHVKLGFAAHVGAGFPDEWFDRNLGLFAVALFFVISGYVMVVSSRTLFGAPRGAVRFVLRRAVRILPPYWIASMLMVAALAVNSQTGQQAWSGSELWRSLLFVPVEGRGTGFTPGYVLWPGWSLFYELVFCATFAAAMQAAPGRAATVLAAGAMLVALVLAGRLLDPTGSFTAPLTRMVVVLFLPGMALALYREGGRVLPGWLRWTCALAAAATCCRTTWPMSPAPGRLRC